MDYQDKSTAYYTFPREDMLPYIPKNAETILEVGCGNGIFIEMIEQVHDKKVVSWGIELMPEYGEQAKARIQNVLIGKVEEQVEKLPDDFFEIIIFNDVIEHLFDPKSVLEKLLPKLKKNGRIISSLPNMRYHEAFFPLLFKADWEYQESGIMDFTHLKFYTMKSIARLFQEAGYSIEKIEGINKTKSLRPRIFNLLMLNSARDTFYKQIATVAVKN